MHYFFNLNEEIPEEFYSDKTGEAFNTCSVCEDELQSQLYFVEKAKQKYPDSTQDFTVFEYAICSNCKANMLEQVSRESMEKIKSFSQKMELPPPVLNEDGKLITEHYLKQCMATGKPIESLKEYHLVGIFKDGKMVQAPFLYGEEMIKQYSEILSEETKGFFDDFFNQITDLPPSLAKILEKEPTQKPIFF